MGGGFLFETMSGCSREVSDTLVGIIIQARMGSTRLPGKVLKDFCGKTLLGWVLDAVSEVTDMATMVVATTTLPVDDDIEKLCKKRNIYCFRGDELNVLSRYYECAKHYGFDDIVRMTADNPFPDIEELRRLIDFHISNQFDYSECYTVLPIGVGMEIFSMRALVDSMEKSTLPRHFEHVDEYILDNLELFSHGTLSVDESKYHPDIRLTVDTEEDYERACYIIRNAEKEKITTREAIRLCMEFEKVTTWGGERGVQNSIV